MADLKKTLELMTQTLTANDLTRVSIEIEDFKIEIEKNNASQQTNVSVLSGDNSAFGTTGTIPADTNAAPAITSGTTGTASGAGALAGNTVKAPIIGTFYAASAPGKEPFVKSGDNVKKGDVLFIIESMKLMNEVLSDFDGVVREIFPANGDPLEYDQPVMVIE
jgi:acetyl-CoA carboxylase biotin carboxyl carrier protein